MRRRTKYIAGATILALGLWLMGRAWAQIDSQAVGSNQRVIQIIGDPASASNKSSVPAVGDGVALAGQFGLLTKALGLLKNASGTYDEARAAVGTTGVFPVNAEGTKATYRAASTALVTVTGATDVFQLCGSGTKTVRVTYVVVSGTIQTAAQYVDITLVRRSTADTGGTSTTPTAILSDTNDGAVTAALLQYTANPTLGTGVGTFGARRYFAALTGTAALMPPAAVWTFGDRPGARTFVLRGTAQCACVNLNAPSNAGTFDIEVEFTEE